MLILAVIRLLLQIVAKMYIVFLKPLILRPLQTAVLMLIYFVNQILKLILLAIYPLLKPAVEMYIVSLRLSMLRPLQTAVIVVQMLMLMPRPLKTVVWVQISNMAASRGQRIPDKSDASIASTSARSQGPEHRRPTASRPHGHSFYAHAETPPLVGPCAPHGT